MASDYISSPKEQALNSGCTLAPPGKNDGFIFVTAVMWPVATMFFQMLVLVYDE